MANEKVELTVEEAKALGFEKAREHRLGTEYNAIYTEDIIKTLEAKGFTKMWGHEGSSTTYATFRCDNDEHEDFGKEIISIYAV
ncbi:hypothetical protein [Poseidonibacter ostreae]|uniref:Uncharacterized protein n=1 Tax=Poseidonibacter ostreae TaxID=2654171 RepID=A0A6L4WWL5_9BACT|nr:hypothetical protein [Poseidonibacter ostreae]KAB7891442.1 hypothetical protein GBG19_00975 [Poseidonibacter ostreae]